jgi:hypothetical protein
MGPAALKWLGFLLTAVALIGLPVAVWVSERWGLIFATLGTLGVVALGLFARSRPRGQPEDESEP